LRDFFCAELVGQAAGQRCGKRPGSPCNTEATGYRAAHLIVRQQHDRKRRPEGTKGDREESLGECGATQCRIAFPQMRHRFHQLRVAEG